MITECVQTVAMMDKRSCNGIICHNLIRPVWDELSDRTLDLHNGVIYNV